MLVSDYSRRDVLIGVVSSFVSALFLTACERSEGSVLSTAARSTARIGVTATASRTAQSSRVAATSRSTPAARPFATPIALLPDPCQGLTYTRPSKPSDPYVWNVVGEGVADSFADKVRRYADLIIVGTVLDIAPARWATPNNQRPDNPHESGSILIITPVLVSVEYVAKGAYDLSEIYFEVPGGRIGQECASSTGSGPRPAFRVADRFLYFVNSDPYLELYPVPEDTRYRYYRANYSYTIAPDNTIKIGPESDIMGNCVDDPPRTLAVNQVLAEIAALLAAPATPTR